MTSGTPPHEHQPDGGRGEEPARAVRMPLLGWIIIALSVIGILVYLVVDHWPHVLAALPYVGIIAVVAMHLFGHRGHGGAGHGERGHSGHSDREPPRTDGSR